MDTGHTSGLVDGAAIVSDVYVHVWEFTVDDASRSDFEREYGPEGRWAALFRRAPGYLGTQLLRDESTPGRYLTIDRWQSAAAYRSFRSAFAEAYESLDRKFEAMTREERTIGSFTEATRLIARCRTASPAPRALQGEAQAEGDEDGTCGAGNEATDGGSRCEQRAEARRGQREHEAPGDARGDEGRAKQQECLDLAVARPGR